MSVGSAAGSKTVVEGKALRRDAAENRRRILTAAEMVFSERGLDAGVDEIARVAGVGMGTLYRRFATKEALISELVRDMFVDLVDMAAATLQVPGGEGLEQLLYGTGALQASHRGCLSRLWNDDQTTAMKNEYRRIIAQLLVLAKDAGRIRRDVTHTDIDLTFWAIRGVIETTRGVSDTAWRRHLAVVIAGMRPGAENFAEPPVDEHDVARAKSRSVPSTG
ncbi:TetR/AcrR family transcriptional regulator [Williamsia muralis]|uniref:TetR/AcrR family transcriptional regulator n=1 Tax=Williamsia marianensis TaxID=85044 RepID=A0ABU4EYT9_WILMA|nr:TetR/AcrR family transcriptional regulator [Williamsia muralis]MDV7136411.1 TetR/AcrR family transcriptional regulator [Williamsia muralis]